MSLDDIRLTVAEIAQIKAELRKIDDMAAEYGIDCETLLALAKSQIATAAENAKLTAEVERLREEAAKQHYLAFEKEGIK